MNIARDILLHTALCPLRSRNEIRNLNGGNIITRWNVHRGSPTQWNVHRGSIFALARFIEHRTANNVSMV